MIRAVLSVKRLPIARKLKIAGIAFSARLIGEKKTLKRRLDQQRHSVKTARIKSSGMYEAFDIDRHDQRSDQSQRQDPDLSS